MLIPEKSSKYQLVIGLEVHVQLMTQSKIFSTEGFEFGSKPNHHVSPITLAHPGALPSFNQACLYHAIRFGLATDCRIAQESFFDRKNYFYPDLPKGYQLSQDRIPICQDGKIEVRLKDGSYKTIRIQRIHLEEDAGKSIHDQHPRQSFIDLNRAGVGLVELVTHPDLRSSEEAGAFLSEIRKIVRYLEISDGNMEEGSLRCDANVSIMPVGSEVFGTRVEIKNLNSITQLTKAIEVEYARQIELLESGGHVTQETRSWNVQKLVTAPMRDKETADDYRYFPEPDLQPITVTDNELEKARKTIPRLPMERFRYYQEELKIKTNKAITLTENRAFSNYFEELYQQLGDPKAAANWMLGSVKAYLNENNTDITSFPLPTSSLVSLIRLVKNGKVGRNAAIEQLFPALLQDPDADPSQLANQLNIIMDSDVDGLTDAVQSIIQKHPNELARYRSGKKALMGFFVGQVMRHFKGKANPKEVNKVVREVLDTPS